MLSGFLPCALTGLEQKRWQKAFDARDELAFCTLFGPDKIVDNLDEFLGYFMIRKVMAGQELLKAAGTVTKKLATWLRDRGHIDEASAADAVDRGVEASRDLPRAEKLSRLLYDLARRAPVVDPDAIPDEDWVEDHLSIIRVESGALWFDDDIGPVKVPKAASDLAVVGWGVNIVMARVKGRWFVMEVGNVCP